MTRKVADFLPSPTIFRNAPVPELPGRLGFRISALNTVTWKACRLSRSRLLSHIFCKARRQIIGQYVSISHNVSPAPPQHAASLQRPGWRLLCAAFGFLCRGRDGLTSLRAQNHSIATTRLIPSSRIASRCFGAGSRFGVRRPSACSLSISFRHRRPGASGASIRHYIPSDSILREAPTRGAAGLLRCNTPQRR